MKKINFESLVLGLALISLATFMMHNGAWNPFTESDPSDSYYQRGKWTGPVIIVVGFLIIYFSLQNKSIADILKKSPFGQYINPTLIRTLMWVSVTIVVITIVGKLLSGG